MKYRCYDCGEVFETPARISEYRGEFWGAPSYEEILVCPNCESDDFDEINEEEESDEEEVSEEIENQEQAKKG